MCSHSLQFRVLLSWHREGIWVLLISILVVISGCSDRTTTDGAEASYSNYQPEVADLLEHLLDSDTSYTKQLDTLPSSLAHVFLARQAHTLTDSLFYIWLAQQTPDLLDDSTERKMHLLLTTEHYEYHHAQQRFDSCISLVRNPQFAPAVCGDDPLSYYVDKVFHLRQIEDCLDNLELDKASAALAELHLRSSQYGRLHRLRDWNIIRETELQDDMAGSLEMSRQLKARSEKIPFWAKRLTSYILEVYYELESDYTEEQMTEILSLQQEALSLATSSRDTAMIHYNQAWYHRGQEEHRQAISEFERARAIFMKLEQYLFVAGVDRGLCLSTRDLKEYKESNAHVVNFMQQLLDHDVQKPEDVRAIDLLRPVVLDTWGLLADNCTELYRESGRIEDRAYAQKCFALIDSSLQLRDIYLEPDARNYIMGIYRAMYGMAMDAVLLDEPSPKRQQLAFRYMEQAKSNRIISRSAMRRCDDYHVPEDICTRESELLDRLRAGSRTAQERHPLELSIDSLRSIIKRDHPEYYRHRYITDELDLEDVSEYVKSQDLSVVQYHWFRDERTLKETYCVMVITPDTTALYTESVPHLRDALSAWHIALADNDRVTLDSLDEVLYQTLWGGIEEYISTDDVVIIPDYYLYRFPFELLGYEWKVGRLDEALLGRKVISYAYSSKSMLEQQRDLQPLGDRYLGMAYNGKSLGDLDPSWAELPGTYDEVRLCSEHASRASVYYGTDCTREHFLESAQDHDILHLAVHGNYEDSDGFLQFRGDSTQRLYLEEIERMDLRGSLVMLTVCKAGDGSIAHSEGIYGVTNAFKVAGAQRVVSSQWDVSDAVAKELVPLFVSHLAERPVPDALRQAKLDYVSQAKNKGLTHPQYWAGFQAFGAR